MICGDSETQSELLCGLLGLRSGWVWGQVQPLPCAEGPHGVDHPPPRFHNETLLDRREHRYGAHLELWGLHPDQAGSYHCKAWNDAGAVRSGTAWLTVLGEYPWPLNPDYALNPKSR